MFVKFLLIFLVPLVSTAELDGTRQERSLQPGAPEVTSANKDQPWQLDPNIGRDEDGNVVTDIKIKNHGDDHEIHAGWNKVVRGPQRAKPTWNVGGTFRWRRSLQPGAPNVNVGNKDQPWQLDPNVARDENGNVITDIKIKNHGEDHEFHAGWNKVVRGPQRAKPTWNVGGTFRWRRSLQPGAPNVNVGNKDQPWQLDPNVGRDENGNVITDIKIKNHGEDHEIHAGWNKVVRGPQRAKPTWNVGGTFRWRRSLQPGAPNVNVGNKDQPWQLDPNVARDENGNVITDIKIKNHGEDHEFHAGWNKVVRGPQRAKPTWNVGGTFRWRRSLQPGAPNINVGNKDQPWQLDPNVARDENGNVITDIKIKNHGEEHEIHAGWNKVVRGPQRAKPTWNVEGTFRWRRSLQPGAPNVNVGNKDQSWQLDPNVARDENGNVITDIKIKNNGEDHEFHAGWNKVVRGPQRAKPTWNVGGTFRWRRSLQPGAPNVNVGNKDQPWQLDPNVARDESGNVITDIKIKNHGEDHEIHAGWNKVVRGPQRAKPTWNVGGTFRWRRSLQPGAPNVNVGNKDQPWQLDPNVARDENGNVITDIKIKNHGEDHEFHAGWNKVVRGPQRAKPTWNVGGTFRWRRSLQPGAPNVNVGNKDQPWQLDPNVARDENGNVITDIKIKNHGEDHEFHAGWNKVVRGPQRAKPTWNVGGTLRWRRSLQPGAPNVNVGNKDQPWQLDPNVGRDENGNVITDIKIKNHGEDHEFHAGWNKVVRGPQRAKPTWNVGGTFRWRRSLQPGAPNVNVGNKDQPWQLDPNVARDENGNVVTDIKIKNHGEDHEFHAGWNKVVRGPSRAKPTWNVGGTIRW